MFDDLHYVVRLYRNDKRSLLHQFVTLGLAIASAVAIWKFLMVVSMSQSPIVVVLSGSMEPSFARGDLMFLNFHDDNRPLTATDIVVFNIRGKEIPVVHRILRHHSDLQNHQKVWTLTKGDNNGGTDIMLYPRGQSWINRDDIQGRAFGCLPGIGMVTILMNDYPPFKWLLLGMLGILVITNKE